ncbi:hypothetical protein BN14_00180 [Rhizoctonia solani AG-1 IB]|uniref:Uncharacterized protein n=1 Tax=Thanatephorus cucumeris (strain AG1-IB / isolate 7/3/14) TaxID=1108050 RepID=M5BHR7_THACB|nr:hypothetical protein BN14_00180 [Rhizoctonia solani AG-1 IB]
MLPDPNARPPSYSFLGILMCIRLLHRLYTLLDKQLKSLEPPPSLVEPTNALALSDSQPLLAPRDADIQQYRYIDSRPITEILQRQTDDTGTSPDPETDGFTLLHVAAIDPALRAGHAAMVLLLGGWASPSGWLQPISKPLAQTLFRETESCGHAQNEAPISVGYAKRWTTQSGGTTRQRLKKATF